MERWDDEHVRRNPCHEERHIQLRWRTVGRTEHRIYHNRRCFQQGLAFGGSGTSCLIYFYTIENQFLLHGRLQKQEPDSKEYYKFKLKNPFTWIGHHFCYFQAADEAKRWGIRLFVIGVGNNVNVDELRTIASDPDNDFLYRVDDFYQLQSLKDTLLTRLCQLVGKWLHNFSIWQCKCLDVKIISNPGLQLITLLLLFVMIANNFFFLQVQMEAPMYNRHQPP